MPIPHTYWPEYDPCEEGERAAQLEMLQAGRKVTDPCGGPCPEGLLDFRTRSTAAAALDPRKP
jgi:hypothetical protein